MVVLGAVKYTLFLRYKVFLILGTSASGSGGDTDEDNDDKPTRPIVFRWYEVDHPSVVLEKKRLLETLPPSYLPTTAVGVSLVKREEANNNNNNNEGACTFMDRTTTNIKEDTKLSTSLPNDDEDDTLHLINHDFLIDPSRLFNKIVGRENKLRTDVPKLFVLECVQMYLPESSSRNLLSYIADRSTTNTSYSFSSSYKSDQQGCALVALYYTILLQYKF